VVRLALAINHPNPADGLAVLAALGGFEIAGLVGVILSGAARRVPVAVDGFIATSAALVANALAPAAHHALSPRTGRRSPDTRSRSRISA